MKARACTPLVSCSATELVLMVASKVASADSEYLGGCLNDVTGNIGAYISETWDHYLHGVGYINILSSDRILLSSLSCPETCSHGGETLATTDWQPCGDATQPELTVSPDVYLDCSSGCGPSELYFSAFRDERRLIRHYRVQPIDSAVKATPLANQCALGVPANTSPGGGC
jgi:hypothetical protein